MEPCQGASLWQNNSNTARTVEKQLQTQQYRDYSYHRQHPHQKASEKQHYTDENNWKISTNTSAVPLSRSSLNPCPRQKYSSNTVSTKIQRAPHLYSIIGEPANSTAALSIIAVVLRDFQPGIRRAGPPSSKIFLFSRRIGRKKQVDVMFGHYTGGGATDIAMKETF